MTLHAPVFTHGNMFSIKHITISGSLIKIQKKMTLLGGPGLSTLLIVINFGEFHIFTLSQVTTVVIFADTLYLRKLFDTRYDADIQ